MLHVAFAESQQQKEDFSMFARRANVALRTGTSARPAHHGATQGTGYRPSHGRCRADAASLPAASGRARASPQK